MSNQLIKCKACGNDLATTAQQCPNCGGINDYIHPQIERFLKDGDGTISVPYQYSYDRFSIRFSIRDKAPIWKPQWHLKNYLILLPILIVVDYLPWIHFLGYDYGTIIGMLMEVIVLINIFAVSIGFIIWGFSWVNSVDGVYGPCKLYFISFKSSPPEINTNDPEYWKEIDTFFKNDSDSTRK